MGCGCGRNKSVKIVNSTPKQSNKTVNRNVRVGMPKPSFKIATTRSSGIANVSKHVCPKCGSLLRLEVKKRHPSEVKVFRCVNKVCTFSRRA